MGRPTPLEVRFWAKVERDGPVVRPELGPCWLWRAAVQRSGHGVFRFNNRTVRAHQVSFFLKHGRWPRLFLLHRCDVARCVRPTHVREGTQRENMREMAARGRNVAQAHPERMPRGERHGNAKLTARRVRAIRARAARGESYVALARLFELSRATIAQVVHRRTWRHVA